MTHIIIEPCGCEESEDLTKALREIIKARKTFEEEAIEMIEVIDRNITVVAAYDYARTKL